MRKFYFFLLVSFFSVAGFAQTGIVKGTVYDLQSSQPMSSVTMMLLQDGVVVNGAYTDETGGYMIEQAIGTYQLVANFLFYLDDTVTVELAEGKITVSDFKLRTDASAGSEFAVEIIAKRDQAGTSALLDHKLKAIQSVDGVSSELIRKTGDINAAAAMQRITGVTVEGGKYVYVRGLGDRYSKTLFNGSELPGLDPDRNTVQMDIFPSGLIDRLVVYKTFTPDLPGSFTGGLIDVVTKDFPEKLTIQASGSWGYNTQSSFNSSFLSYQRGKLDFLGFDDGTRKMPEVLQDKFGNVKTIPAPSNNPVLAQQVESASTAFKTNMDIRKTTSLMNQSYNFSIGNQFSFLKKPLGYFFGLSYRNGYNYYDNGANNVWYQTSPASTVFTPKTQLNDQYGYNVLSSNDVLWGALANLSWQLSSRNKIAFNYMRNQSAETFVRSFEGIIPQDNPDWKFQTRTLGYTQRSLNAFQLKGVQQLRDKLTLDWIGALTRSSQYEPDLRFFSNHYTLQNGQPLYEINKSAYTLPSRYYRYMKEYSYDIKANIEQKFKTKNEQEAKLKVGAAYNYKVRDFEESRFHYVINRYQGTATSVFLPENLGVIGEDEFQNQTYGNYIENVSESRNSYGANQHLFAGYVMGEYPFSTRFKVVAGVRPEYLLVNVTSKDKQIIPTHINNLNILPATTFIFAIKEKMNLKMNYTQTVARGSFREFAPFTSFAFINGNYVTGNPALQNTTIHNADVRWESSPRIGEIITVGAYYKYFKNPIEIVFNNGGNIGELTWRNVAQAQSYGVELEVRKKLDFIPALKNFQLGGNVSLIHSVVDKDKNAYYNDSIFDPSTSRTRPMFMQSPYVVNADLSYTHDSTGWNITVNYNIFGKRISVVSSEDAPAAFELPRHSLNITVNKTLNKYFSVNFRAGNILNPQFKQVQYFKGQPYIFQNNTRGRDFVFGVSYKF